jgi:DNA integrity scanning protein DisA with diadenylate cyclase activity
MSETAVSMPSVDFSYQFNIAREKVEKKIFALLCSVSKKLFEENKKVGALIVLGAFDHKQVVPGMRQISSKKIEKYINVAFPSFESDVLALFESGDDGAIIINQFGQILGSGIYLIVDNPNLDIPEGAGTRHITAASISTRADVVSAYTLSEETLAVRMWKLGQFTEQFKPEEEFSSPEPSK